MAARDGVFTVIQGSDRTLKLQLLDENGNLFDLTGATEIKFLCCPASGNTLLERLLTASDIVVTQDTAGKIDVILDAAFSPTMKADEEQDFEVTVLLGGKLSIWSFEEQLTVKARLSC
jgi:hypothetical protein